jgi:DNA-binding MarR family transcriptional regulator
MRTPVSRPLAARSAPRRAPSDAAGTNACGLLILRLGRAAAFRLGSALSALEMRPHEFAVLTALADAGPMSQGRLGATVRVHASNLVALIDGLEADGFVLRRRDPADRRRYLVELTPGGRRRLERARHAAEHAEDELLAPLDEAERERLHDYLTRIAAHACGGRSC